MIKYQETSPSLSDYRHLFESTGWTASIPIFDESIQSAIENSWHWISVFDNGWLIAMSRLISDGGLYAFVCDMIVLPPYQKQGIGKTMLKMLKDQCIKCNIQVVWLFSAPGKSSFYEMNGFEVRALDAPGMQMRKI